MSRTYRKGIDWKYKMHGHYYDRPPPWVGWQERIQWYGICLARLHTKKARDGKRHNGLMCSPPKWYKDERRRCQRHADNQAVYMDKDPATYKKSDRYDWW